MTAAEVELIARARELIRLGRFAVLASMLIPVVAAAIAGEASREFLGKSFDLACRSILAAENHSAAARNTVAHLCRLSIDRFGKQPWTDLCQACLLHLAGSHDAAVPFYLTAAAETQVLWPPSNGCKTVMTLSEVRSSTTADAASMTAQLPEVILHRRAGSMGPFVVFAAADHDYFIRYGDDFLRSAQSHGDVASAHLHLINPRPEAFELVEEAVRSRRWPDLTLSSEAYDGPDRRAYYASARLVRAPMLLKLYDCPLLISDIDAVYRAPIRQTLPDLNKLDVGLYIKNDRFRAHPWQTIRAGILIYGATGFGNRFSTAAARLTMNALVGRNDNDRWFIDQNMLYHVWLLAQTDGWNLNIVNLEARLPGQILFKQQFT
jgi:hypothetical protein